MWPDQPNHLQWHGYQGFQGNETFTILNGKLKYSCRCNRFIPNFTPPMVVNKERSLGFWCGRIGHQYFALLNERLGHLGLDRGYFTLALIVDHKGLVSQQELADALHMDKVAMARSIDHLCERGFVERAACPDDRRKHHLKVMPKAIAAVKEIKQAYAALDRMALKGLPAAERGQLLGQLRDALGNIHEASKRPQNTTKNQRTA